MSSNGSEASAVTKYGATPAFSVSAQKPLRADPRRSATMFNPVMRMPPAFQPYHNTATPPTREARFPAPKSSVPSKRSAPATITFIEQKPATTPLDQPHPKRPRVDEIKPSKYRYTNKKTPFSIHRPLKNAEDVHKDIWTNILSCCPPRFLLQAKTVNSLFYGILSQQSLWRHTRNQHLSADLPPCPEGINEQQYTDLLVGKGCQSASCRRENTVATNWALLVRLCPDCLMSKTIRNQDLPVSRVHFIGSKSLAECLPMLLVTASHRSEPREVRNNHDDNTPEYSDSGRSSTYRFLRSSYDRLETEYLNLQKTGASEAEIAVWYKEKSDVTMRQMKDRGQIHYWTLNNPFNLQAMDTRVLRRPFFEARAQELDPPIARSTLERFESFQKALATQNGPTIRSWETLKAKILPLRKEAEELEQALKRVERPASDDIWTTLSDHRGDASKLLPVLKPEQEFVVDIARKELKRCRDEGVADSDLVLLTLKHVHQRYYSRERTPHGLNYNGKHGPYMLSLDDCRLILDFVIKKEISAYSQQGARVYNRFRCPACVSAKERGRYFSFTGCFEHLLNHHGKTVGDGPEFWRYALAERPQRGVYWYRTLPFPWYTVRWPRCLPILPGHQDPTLLEPWDPASDRPYIREQVSTTSVFEGRHVNAKVEAASFLELFKHAAQAMTGIRLTGHALTRIALQFAVDASQQRDLAQPSLMDFMDVVPEVQGINPAMDFRFRCGACMAKGDQKSSARHVKHNIPLAPLFLHWTKCHDDDAPARARRQEAEDAPGSQAKWVENFMHLPTDSELYELIIESDQSLEREKESIRAAAAAGNARKKPKAKASVVLATPSAMEAFDSLFPRVAQVSEGQ